MPNLDALFLMQDNFRYFFKVMFLTFAHVGGAVAGDVIAVGVAPLVHAGRAGPRRDCHTIST